MARNSAASKGYRKYQKKTWWEQKTPEEQKKFTRMCAIACAAAVAVILLIVFVPKIIDNSKNLKVVDGQVQVEDNVMLCDLGTSSNHKYRQLATISGAAEGFTSKGRGTGLSDQNIPVYTFEGEHAEYTLSTAINDAQAAIENYAGRVVAFGEIVDQSEPEKITLDGREAWWNYTTLTPVDLTGDGTEELPPYRQYAVFYIQSKFKGISALCVYTDDLQSLDEAMDHDAVFAKLEEIAGTITMAER